MKLFRRIKKISLSILVLGTSMTLNSCLKDNNPPPTDSSWPVPNIVSFQDNGGEGAGGAGYGSTTTPYPLYEFGLTLNGNDTAGFAAIVVYGPKSPAPVDITVNLALDTAGMNVFSVANSIVPSLTCPDPSTFTFPSSVVIPKGQTQAYARVTVNGNSTPDPNALYCIPLMITSSSYGTVSGNFNVEINFFYLTN
jgi:uncharacterized protein DUF1735